VLLSAAPSCDKVRALPKRAECEHKAGHVVRALSVLDEHLAAKPKDKKALKLRALWAAEAVTFEWFSEPDGALVSVDADDPIGGTPITATVDPGLHTFHFTHEGCVQLERKETAVSGTRPKLTAVLERVGKPDAGPEPGPAASATAAPATTPAATAAAAPAAAPAQAVAPAPEKPAGSRAPYILGTAGLFVAIGGGVLVFTSILALSPGVPNEAAVTREYVGFGLIGVGVAAGVAAIVWLLIDRPPGAGTRR
jgi:hypothetical protein